MFSEFCGLVLINSASAVNLQRAIHCFKNRLGCLGISRESHLVNNSKECNPDLLLEASFGNKRWPVGTLYSPLLGDFIRIASHILGSSHCYRLPYYPSNVPAVSICIPSFNPISPPSFVSVPTCSQSTHKICILFPLPEKSIEKTQMTEEHLNVQAS